MCAGPQIVGVHGTSDAAIRRAASHYEDSALNAALDQFDADEAFEDLIDDLITDADYAVAASEHGLADFDEARARGIEPLIEAAARDIVAERLRQGELG